MAFIVEDGLGRRGANSYASVKFARDYTTERGRTEFDALSDDAVEVLLIRATDYIELRWGPSFSGEKKYSFQTLHFPATKAYDARSDLITKVPAVLCRAVTELAQRATGLDRLLSDPPAPYPVKDDTGAAVDVSSGELASETKQVGTIRTVKSYATSGQRKTSIITASQLTGISIQSFPEVERMVGQLISGCGPYGNMTVKN